jgi:hypothetical protein
MGAEVQFENLNPNLVVRHQVGVCIGSFTPSRQCVWPFHRTHSTSESFALKTASEA